MPLIDVRAARLDVASEVNDDLTVQFIFGYPLSGWTSWTATATYRVAGVNTPVTLTVDTSQQASNIITVTLPSASATFTDAVWNVRAHDPNGKQQTLFKGTIVLGEAP